MSCNTFQPGWRVPASGVYRVHHFQHRQSHLVSIHRGETFPECVTCKHLVRFEEVLTLVGLAGSEQLEREAQEKGRNHGMGRT